MSSLFKACIGSAEPELGPEPTPAGIFTTIALDPDFRHLYHDKYLRQAIFEFRRMRELGIIRDCDGAFAADANGEDIARLHDQLCVYFREQRLIHECMRAAVMAHMPQHIADKYEPPAL